MFKRFLKFGTSPSFILSLLKLLVSFLALNSSVHVKVNPFDLVINLKMESETSGTPDDTSFTHKAEGWDDAASLEGMTSDQNVRGWDVESGDAFRIHLEMPADNVSSED